MMMVEILTKSAGLSLTVTTLALGSNPIVHYTGIISIGPPLLRCPHHQYPAEGYRFLQALVVVLNGWRDCLIYLTTWAC